MSAAIEKSGADAAPAIASRADRAAIFLMLLGDEEAATLLARMQPDELQTIGSAMVALGDIDQPQMAEALQDFVAEAGREIVTAKERGGKVRALFERSIGPMRAESMMERIGGEEANKTIEIARWLSPTILIKLIEGEHPQMIAALLLMLEAETAAEILALLPDDQQPDVVERIARMGPLSARSTAMIDRLLSQKIGTQFGPAALAMGGPRDAANLINLAAGDVRNTVLPSIAIRDEELAKAIEEQLFTFDMLLELEPLDMGRLLRDVESEKLVDALKGLPEEHRNPFFAAMSSRAADGIRDEIELRGKMTRSEAEAAQRSMLEVAKGLVDQGEISLGADDGEFI